MAKAEGDSIVNKPSITSAVPYPRVGPHPVYPSYERGHSLLTQPAPHHVFDQRGKNVNPSAFDTTAFQFNDPASLAHYFINTAEAKANSPYLTRIYSGLLAGLFITLGALFVVVAAGGLATSFTTSYPGVQRLIAGTVFPAALILILMIGGDLFTGDCMYMGIGWLAGRVTFRQVSQVLIVSYFSNLAGCLFFTYFLGRETFMFSDTPWDAYVVAQANGRVFIGFGPIFLRAVGANTLVCLAIYMGSASRSALGRAVLTWIPVWIFVSLGWEHVIADMSFVPLAMYYGSPITVDQYIRRNLVPVTIGNWVGGFWLVGGTAFYLYSYSHRSIRSATLASWLRYNFVPDLPAGQWLQKEWVDFRFQMSTSLPYDKNVPTVSATSHTQMQNAD